MKYTNLDMVQIIASSIDSDEVNSVNDSVESQQILKLIRTCFFDIIERNNLPEHLDIVNLQSSGSSTYPVVMYVPTTVSKIYWVKYNKQTPENTDLNFQQLTFLTLQDFMDRMYQLGESDDEVLQMDLTTGGNTIPFLYKNNKHPEYYTSFDDRTLVFDSHLATEDSYLAGGKTLALGKEIITYSMTDTFVPPLDESQFTLLLNEAKALAWIELRQTPHPKAELNAKRAWVNTQKSKNRVPGVSDLSLLPDFGRR
jgi:hypothetical protein